MKLRVLCMTVMSAAIILTGCSSNSQGDVQVLDGYELQPQYAGALDFAGNDAVFTVRIVKAESPQVGTISDSGGVRGTYVYTPITAVVTEVLKAGGESVTVGQTVTLRVAGGTTGGRTTVNKITAEPSDYASGALVQIFSGKAFHDPESGQTQYVPNWSFEVGSTTLTNLHDRKVQMSLGDANNQAQEVAAWRGWQR